MSERHTGPTSHSVDAHPIKSLVRWLASEPRSIGTPETSGMERSMSEINELKRRIAAGEYSMDPNAIAEAMFSRANRMFFVGRPSEVLEPGKRDGAPSRVDEL
jgi:hypothetical protein